MLRRLFPLALALVASPVAAQVTATLPVTCNASGTICTPATPVTNPDGTNIGTGSSGTPTGSAGTPNAAVVTVQGISGGTVVPVSAASLPLPTGAATEATLAATSGKLPASLGAKTGATSLSVVPNSDTAFPISAASLPLPTGASTETTLAAASAKLPASLGAKTGATSLSVVPASDGFAVVATGNVANGVADTGNPIKVGGYAAATTPTTASGAQRVNLWLGLNGQTVIGGTSFTGADATSNTMAQSTITAGGSGLFAMGNFNFNGTTWDRQRGDTIGAYIVPTPTATAGNALTPVVTSVAAGSVVGKASAGNLYGVNVTSGASAGYVLVFNATSAPADGTVTPIKCLPIAANSGLEMNYRHMPVAFSTGITVVFSTTGCFTKTISATAFISVDAK